MIYFAGLFLLLRFHFVDARHFWAALPRYTAGESGAIHAGLSLAGLSGPYRHDLCGRAHPRAPLIMTCAFLSALGLIAFALPNNHTSIMVGGYFAAFFLEGIFAQSFPSSRNPILRKPCDRA